MTKARDIADLLSTANGKIAGENLDVSFENITDTGTEGTRVATGTTAQRGTTQGQLRFNTTTGLAEYYTGTAFKSIDAPPTVSSIDVTEVDSQAGGNQTIVITGSGFSSGAIVTFIGNSGTDFNASTVTVDSDTQITAVAPKSSFLNAQEPYGVKVTNVSGLAATLASQINVDTAPSWNTASGSLGNIYDSARSNISITVSATDADGDTIAYSVQSGSLPNGLSLNSSTGAITGTASAVGSDTTSSFTIRATAGSKTADRAFTITVNAPVTQAFTYSGSNQTFTVPSGLTSVTAYMWGAGGGGGHTGGWQDGSYAGGGGSATGTIDVSSISSLIVIVGQGGEGQDGSSSSGIYQAFGGGGGNSSTGDNRYAGGGGGLSGIFNSSYTHSNSILIAGGGGGGGSMNTTSGQHKSKGGAGGGTTGADGSSVNNIYRGFGGTQSAGGAGGSGGDGNGIAGSALQGGDLPLSGYGGGGGGGYYGGSSGTYKEPSDMGGGGGGSGYAHPSLVSNATLYQGSNQTPGNSSSSYRSGAGDGGNYGTTGDNGRVVIVY
jgi:hypothetical protein